MAVRTLQAVLLNFANSQINSVQDLNSSVKTSTLTRMDTREWLKAITRGDSLRTIEKKTGVSYGTVNSQRTTRVSAENVIAIARGYGIPPVSALVETEYLTADEGDVGDPKTAIHNATEEDLASEVLRRMKLPGLHSVFTTPLDDLIGDENTPETPPSSPA